MKDLLSKLLAFAILFAFDLLFLIVRAFFIPSRLYSIWKNKKVYDKQMTDCNERASTN